MSPKNRSISLILASAILYCLVPGSANAEIESKSKDSKEPVDDNPPVFWDVDTDKSPSSPIKLEGKAEITDVKPGDPRSAAINYRKGYAALDKGNYSKAADYFRLTADQFGKGFEGYRAEARFAEAQCRMKLGQKAEANKLYGIAIDLFRKHKPKSPYLKAAIEQRGKMFQLKMQIPKMHRIMHRLYAVDKNITLKGKIKEDGSLLKGQDAVLDVEKKFVNDSVHQCFVEMTCLETAELGSNSTNARNRWVPLMAYGKTAAISTTGDIFFCPVIKVKINGKHYNIHVDLPGLANTQRTVMLVTDGYSICAIDPVNNDVWLLKMNLKKKKKAKASKGSFKWKKLKHQKGRIKHITKKTRRKIK